MAFDAVLEVMVCLAGEGNHAWDWAERGRGAAWPRWARESS